MIIRKPYAFLIKNFKIIHLLLLIPMLYLAFKFGDIASFFREYVAAQYTTPETIIAGNYITILIYIVLFLLIIANSIIYLLMKSKKKNTLYYIISIIYYLILLASTVLFYASMQSIEKGTMDQTFANFVRDMGNILVIPVYLLMVATVTKGLGFNYKSFRFDGNVDLQVTDDDDAEVELKIGADSYTVKRKFVHILRELKYYVLENKFVFTCLGVGLTLLIIIVGYLNFEIYNKKYNVYQAFALDSFTMTLKESYISDVDYSGNTIAEGKYYLAVKIAIQNRTLTDQSIDKSNFRIFIGNKVLYPKYDRSSRFIDIGKNYQGETIYSNTSNDYVLVYEIDSSLVKRQYQMKILSALKSEPGKLIPSYKIVTIKPNNITKKENMGVAKLGTEINLKDTLLGNTTYTLRNITFDKKYSYSYQKCTTTDECYNVKDTILPSTGNSLAIIEDNIDWDNTTAYYANGTKDFYSDFATIVYNYNNLQTDKTYVATLKNVTPKYITDVKIYEVPEMITRSFTQKITLKISIRNKVFTIKLKE